MRSRIIVSLLFVCLSEWHHVHATEPSNIVCQELEAITIFTKTFESTRLNRNAIYRFSREGLYISSPIREEYFYNKVKEDDFNRFISGNKTMIFDSSEFETGIFIHSDNVEVTVSKVRCIKT